MFMVKQRAIHGVLFGVLSYSRNVSSILYNTPEIIQTFNGLAN